MKRLRNAIAMGVQCIRLVIAIIDVCLVMLADWIAVADEDDV